MIDIQTQKIIDDIIEDNALQLDIECNGYPNPEEYVRQHLLERFPNATDKVINSIIDSEASSFEEIGILYHVLSKADQV